MLDFLRTTNFHPMDPVNLAAVLTATVAAFVLGMLWYGPVFGGYWKKLMGFSDADMKAMKLSPMAAMVVMLVLSFLLNYVLAHGIAFGNIATGMSGVEGGMVGAFWYWLGFGLTFTAGPFLWENKSWKLWAFNAVYYLISFEVAGAILGAWA